MRNTLTIEKDTVCTCSCIDSVADDTNSIFIFTYIENVSNPKLLIYLNGALQKTAELTVNAYNLIVIPRELFVAYGVITFKYQDDDYIGETFTINFPANLTGSLSVKRVSEYVYTAKYTAPGGSSATVSVKVNSTTTGEPGTNANVVNSGTDENVKLDFTIPRGAKGDKGDKGDTGPQGPAGTVEDISPLPVTFSQPSSTGTEPASGNALNGIVGWLVKKASELTSGLAGKINVSNGVANSDLTINPRGSAGDNGHLKFPSGNNGLAGWIGSCNNTLRMYGFNSSGTYKDAYLQLTDGSFYVTGGIKAKGGDVTNSSGQTLGGAHYRLPKFYSKSGTNVSLANSSFSDVAAYNVPSNGYALVSLGGLFSGMGTSSVVRRIAGLLLNGAEYMNFETTAGSTARLWSSGCIAIPVSKSNIITGRFYQNSGSTKTLEQWKFSVIFFPN